MEESNQSRGIPDNIMQSLERYRDTGIPTGGFLLAVLTNDLYESVARADSDSLESLPLIVKWVAMELPYSAWGDHDSVHKWIISHQTEELEFVSRAPSPAYCVGSFPGKI